MACGNALYVASRPTRSPIWNAMWRLSTYRLRVGNAVFVTSIVQVKMRIMFISTGIIKANRCILSNNKSCSHNFSFTDLCSSHFHHNWSVLMLGDLTFFKTFIYFLFYYNLYICADLLNKVQAKMTKIPGGWQCRECPFNSKYTTTVRRHIEAKHMADFVNCCHVCGKFCTTSDALKRHQKEHILEFYQNESAIEMNIATSSYQQ